MARARRDSSPGRLALALPSIWRKVRFRWSPSRVNSVDESFRLQGGSSPGTLSNAVSIGDVYAPTPRHERPRSLSCQLPGPPLQWQLMVDDESCRSSGNSPRNSFSSTGSVTSQASGYKEGKNEQSGSSSHTRAGLSKLVRLLNPREKSVAGDRPSRHGSDNSLARDPSSMRKANSIDSLLESSSSASFNQDVPGGYSTSPSSQNGKTLPSSPSVPAKLESHKRGIIPASPPTMPSKMAKGALPGLRGGSVERIIESGPLTKAERKKMEKVNKFNIDLQALFAAVEHEYTDRARSILETTDVNVNSVNGDGFTPLDLAVMTTNVAMVKLLQAHGAAESPRFSNKEGRASHLQGLVREAGRCVEDLSNCVLSAATNGSLSAALLKEKERQLSLWQRRHHLLKRMKAGFERIRPPDPPSNVQLEVIGTRSLKVKFVEPKTAHEQDSIVAKYKVEWSCYEDFSPPAGSQEISDIHKLEVTIPDLTQGSAYFIRVAAGNVKGYSAWRSASPLSATPSSWRDVEGKTKSSCSMGRLDDLFHQIANSRASYGKEIKDLLDTPQQHRRQVRKSLKHLFASAPKFHKNMKRGVFLACLLYHDDKVAVTAEDTLPIIEVDENYPSPLHTDFYWLMKIACTWEDVKTLRQDMEKSQSSSNIHFRGKLLQAVEQMQSALGFQDLGRLYYRPFKDSDGTTVICVVKNILDPKSVVTLSVRWMSLHKLNRKRINNSENIQNPNVNDLLLDSLQEVMTYNKASVTSLSRGLYVGYVKLKSSVDVIRVLVPNLTPNVLPHCKVRENPHVSCEEWQWFRSMSSIDYQPDGPNEVQLKFLKAVSTATKHLLNDLSISECEADTHRFYDVEVIELSKDVSLLLVLPPVDSVCSVPGQYDDTTSKIECISLPVQIFEMTHMATYQTSFISRYSRLSSILEMNTIVANHAHREAFSSTEVAEAKSRLNDLQELHAQVDSTWKSARWIMDVLTFARDKQASGGIPLKNIWLDRSTPSSPSPISDESPQYEELVVNRRIKEEDKADNISLNGTWVHEMRRCSSTSRLQDCGTTDMEDQHSVITTASSVSSCPKAHSAERLGSYSADEATSHKRDSFRSSFTGSLSSLDIMLDDDKISVYSKDSACSTGDEAKKADSDLFSVSPVMEPTPMDHSGIIRVYAAYETGLPSGTSVKLHITPMTTAREVVDLVVKQLNMAVVLKGRGGPIYNSSHLQSFCLVAMIGTRERCFRDDFQPMQNPWIRGKLYVRRKTCRFQLSVD